MVEVWWAGDVNPRAGVLHYVTDDCFSLSLYRQSVLYAATSPHRNSSLHATTNFAPPEDSGSNEDWWTSVIDKDFRENTSHLISMA